MDDFEQVGDETFFNDDLVRQKSSYEKMMQRNTAIADAKVFRTLKKVAEFDALPLETRSILAEAANALIMSGISCYILDPKYDAEGYSNPQKIMAGATYEELFKPVDIDSYDFRDEPAGDQVWCFDDCYVHIDMDCFYASVEIRDNPCLGLKPLAVALGVVCACNYPARPFGVRAGLPVFQALELCPDLICVPPNMEKYAETSADFFSVIRAIDSNYISTGLDEVSIDVSAFAAWKSLDHLSEFVRNLRNEIFLATGCHASAGVANTRLIAKNLCSRRKPDGQFILHPRYSLYYLLSLKPNKLTGIGKSTGRILSEGLSADTVLKAIQCTRYLQYMLPPKSCQNLLELLMGTAYNQGNPYRKTISASRSFPVTDSIVDVFRMVDTIALRLLDDCKKNCVSGTKLNFWIRNSGFGGRGYAFNLPELSYSVLVRVGIHLCTRYINEVTKKNASADKIYDMWISGALTNSPTPVKLPIKFRSLGMRLKDLTHLAPNE